jgi:hypothetical protein
MSIATTLALGFLGIIWVAGAFTKPKFPNKNRTSAIIATIAASIIFSLPIVFSQISIATSIDLFGFIGCILGLIGCARLVFLIFPNA